MKIKSNAASQKVNSPFFIINEKFCHDFERFIASKNGMVKGSYNAWSFIVFGKIESERTWNLKYKKAIYSSTGSLVSILYKEEVYLTLAVWTCENMNTDTSSFFVRKRTFWDNFNPRYSRLKLHRDYVVKSGGKQTKLFSQLIAILQPLFSNEEIFSIRLKNSKLTIELRSDEHHFDIFNQLLSL